VRPTPEIWGLVEELGLAGSALLADPRLPRFVELDGKLHRLAPGPQTLLLTRLLSPLGKLRLLAEPFVRSGTEPRESVRAFFARRLGWQVADRLVAPFVSGIWAGDADRLSAASAFPVLKRWEIEHGSLLRGALSRRPRHEGSSRPVPRGLLSFSEGLETLPRALADRLGPRLRTESPVRTLKPDGKGWRIETERETFPAARVVVACPASEAARLLEPLDPSASRALAEVPQPPLAVLHFSWPAAAFRRPLHGFGHLVVPTHDRRVLGAVWSSCLFAGRAPEGRVLVTAFVGGARDSATPSLPDADLAELAGRELAVSLGAGSPASLVRVTRYARALPQYDLDHESRMQAVAHAEARMPGLSLIGNYRGGISVGDVVRHGLAATGAGT